MTTPFDPSRPGGPRRPADPEDMSAVERLLAYEEIRQLAARYALAMDARDFACLVSLFVEDVRSWDGRRGRDILQQQFEWAFRHGMGGRVGITHIGTHVINLLDADHAGGTLYCLAEFGDRDRWTRQAIAYEDTYERRDGAWYFVDRDHRLFYGADVDLQPLNQPTMNWPQEIVGVGALPYDWPSWKAWSAGARNHEDDAERAVRT